jgi:hypothetical protein
MDGTFFVPDDLWRPIVEGDMDPTLALDVIETRQRFEELLRRRHDQQVAPEPAGPIAPRLSWLLGGAPHDPDVR